MGVLSLQVASNGPSGFPHLVAMWFAVLPADELTVAFWTYSRSQKVINLQRDPRVACMVEDGDTYPTLRGVQLAGQAVVSDDRRLVQRVGEAVYERYNGPLDDGARAAVEQMGAKRVAVLCTASRVVSWDHRKLGGRY
jgi:PPOX class probable F420-dependent enzyme